MKLFTRISRTVRLAVLALVLAMLFTMQGMPVLAQAAGSNDVHRILTKSSVKNPSYNASTGMVTWDIVQFGSYPQTEVQGSALTAAITGASYDNNGDAWVGGVKYRRISKKDTNNSVRFGTGTYRYFKWEDIDWQVLKNDGSTVFLTTLRGIDCKDYHEAGGDVTWADCSLRSWMNGTFYNTAFSSGEKNAIVKQNVVNADNPFYGTPGGKDTQDNVYALSSADVTNVEYGFRRQWDELSDCRSVKFSDYAYAMGAYPGGEDDSCCYWWLRTSGKSPNKAMEVTTFGNVRDDDDDVDTSNTAVRPALHVKLSYLTGNPTGDSAQPLKVSTPADQTVKTGEKAVFQVTASGGSPASYTYQWFWHETKAGTQLRNEHKLNGQTSSTLTVTTEPASDGKYYFCIVSDGNSRVVSDRAKLTVYYPPSVALEPSNLTVKIGEKGVVKASVKEGNPSSCTYRWYWADSKTSTGNQIEKLTDAGVVITPTSTVLNGKYLYCTVSNGQYEATSNRVLVTVISSGSSTQAQPAEKYDQEITYSAAKIKKGKVVYGTKPFPLNAESSGDGGLSYASSDTSVLTVNTAGKVTVKGYGRVTITITAAATDNYNRTSRLVDLTVVPKKAEITDGGLKNGKAYFKWKKDGTVSGYQFCWASNQAFTKNVKKKSVKGTSIKLPVSDKAMYVRVRAYKKAGSQTYYGDWSSAWRL